MSKKLVGMYIIKFKLHNSNETQARCRSTYMLFKEASVPDCQRDLNLYGWILLVCRRGKSAFRCECNINISICVQLRLQMQYILLILRSPWHVLLVLGTKNMLFKPLLSLWHATIYKYLYIFSRNKRKTIRIVIDLAEKSRPFCLVTATAYLQVDFFRLFESTAQYAVEK